MHSSLSQYRTSPYKKDPKSDPNLENYPCAEGDCRGVLQGFGAFGAFLGQEAALGDFGCVGSDLKPYFRFLGLGFRAWGLGFRVKGLGFRV